MTRIRTGGSILSAVVALVTGTSTVQAATFEVLYEIPMMAASGVWNWQPLAGVSPTPDGRLLGTLGHVGLASGVDNFGMVYRLTPSNKAGVPWTFDFIHKFPNAEGSPQAELTRTSAGTYIGGSSRSYKNFGEVFELTSSTTATSGWDFTTIHSFTWADHLGAGPTGALTEGPDGKFYGTSDGDFYTSGYGGVFRLTRPDQCGCGWTFESLYAFPDQNTTGEFPSSRPVVDAKGVIYATEKQYGTVFSLTPPKAAGDAWTHKVLYDFADAKLESGLTPDGTGGFYGASSTGGAYGRGFVYHLMRPQTAGGKWTMARIHSFPGGPGGSAPQGELVKDKNGVLYGVTNDGTAPYTGTVYTLTPPATAGGRWTMAVLHRFTGKKTGMHPVGRVALGPGGWIYGVTQWGGAQNKGLVYRVKP